MREKVLQHSIVEGFVGATAGLCLYLTYKGIMIPSEVALILAILALVNPIIFIARD